MMTAAVDIKGTQDWVVDYNGEGTMVASDAGDSGVVMMATMVEEGVGQQKWQPRKMMVADDNAADDAGLQDRAADYDRVG
jgi:hypothetical protein